MDYKISNKELMKAIALLTAYEVEDYAVDTLKRQAAEQMTHQEYGRLMTQWMIAVGCRTVDCTEDIGFYYGVEETTDMGYWEDPGLYESYWRGEADKYIQE